MHTTHATGPDQASQPARPGTAPRPGQHPSARSTPPGRALRLLSSAIVALAGPGLPALHAHPPEQPPTQAQDKSHFTLLNPTPAALMREMSTDRPDKTESPYTVDAGHFQIEMDLVSHTRDRDRSNGGDTRVEAWAIAPVNLKVGVLNSVDLQLILESYNHVTTEDRTTGTRLRQNGFGDLTTRVKINLWGNDGGTTALAAMPYVKIPTNQDHLGNSSVEGGLILPVAVELPAGFSLGLMSQLDFILDGDGNGHHPEFVHTATIGRAIVGDLSAYLEFFSAVSAERGPSPWVGTVDFGFTYALTPNLQLDAGVNIGVTDSADDWNPFLGVSMRF